MVHVFYERSLDEKNFNYNGNVHLMKNRDDDPTVNNNLFDFNFSRDKFNWKVSDVYIDFQMRLSSWKHIQCNWLSWYWKELRAMKMDCTVTVTGSEPIKYF